MARDCPHCGARIEYLNYSCNTTAHEWGTIDDRENWDRTDSETSDSYDYEYKCPECREEIDVEDGPYAWLTNADSTDDDSTTWHGAREANIWSNAQGD